VPEGLHNTFCNTDPDNGIVYELLERGKPAGPVNK